VDDPRAAAPREDPLKPKSTAPLFDAPSGRRTPTRCLGLVAAGAKHSVIDIPLDMPATDKKNAELKASGAKPK
jgi:hypothetical protein